MSREWDVAVAGGYNKHGESFLPRVWAFTSIVHCIVLPPEVKICIGAGKSNRSATLWVPTYTCTAEHLQRQRVLFWFVINLKVCRSLVTILIWI